jgi:hypothetical protein
MLNDFLTSTRQNVLDRVSSPLITSFMVSWCLWNYKFIIILFSDTSVTQTFEMIERISFPGWESVISHGIFLPLTSAVVYVFGYPYPARFTHKYLKKQSHLTNDHNPMSEEDYVRIQTKIRTEKEKQEDDIKKLTMENTKAKENHQSLLEQFNNKAKRHSDEITELKQSIKKLEDQNSSYAEILNKNKKAYEEVNKIKRGLSASQLKIIKMIEENNGAINEYDIFLKTNTTEERVILDLKKLTGDNLVNAIKVLDKDSENYDGFSYTLSPKGHLLFMLTI